MGKTVIGLFDDYDEAQRVVDDLTSAGFQRDDISVVSNNSTSRFGNSGGGASGGGPSAGGVVGGAVGGAAEGAMIGGLTGLAASLALLLIPGIGPIAAVGPLAATLSGAGIGAVGGGVIGGLSKLGVPKEHAEYYAEGIRRGGTLVSVTTDEARANRAHEIFERHNPVDIEERAAYYRSTGFSGYSEKAPHYTPEQITADRTAYSTYASSYGSSPNASTTAGTTGGGAMPGATTGAVGMTGTNRAVESGQEVRVPIVEEELAVGKREVERGRARIHTYVQETPVTEQVTLREEHVNVERHAVNRPVAQGDLTNAFEERTIDIQERAEVPVVSKEARVVEEVVINKEATERTETVHDTVRRTEVDVDEDDDAMRTDTAVTGTTRTGTGGSSR